jgi:hypothetical protein
MGIAQDLAYLSSTANNLEDYLMSDSLYYPLGGDMQLGLGAMNEALWRLRSREDHGALSATQREQLHTHVLAIDDVRKKLKALYDTKARKEFRSRVDTWRWFIDDPVGGPKAWAAQAWSRIRLALLKLDVEQPKEAVMWLDLADRTLRERFTEGPFVIDADLEPAASRTDHWWLWGKPR